MYNLLSITKFSDISRESMYKIRFKNWGLRKYNSGENSRIFAKRSRVEDSRDNAHGPSTRTICLEELGQLLEQQNLTLEEFINQQSPVPPMLEGTFNPRHIGSPMDFELPEKLLHAVDIYFLGSFESKKWQNVGEGQAVVSTLDSSGPYTAWELCSFLGSAMRISSRKDTTGAQQAWSRVSDSITSVVKKENLDTSIYLCYLMRKLRGLGKYQIAKAILEQCARLTASLKEGGQEHPLCVLLCQLLQAAHSSDVDHLMLLVLERIVDILEDELGEAHLETLGHRAARIAFIPNFSTRATKSRELFLKYHKMDIPIDSRLDFLLTVFELSMLISDDFAQDAKDFKVFYTQLKGIEDDFPSETLFSILVGLVWDYEDPAEMEKFKQATQRAWDATWYGFSDLFPLARKLVQNAESKMAVFGHFEADAFTEDSDDLVFRKH